MYQRFFNNAKTNKNRFYFKRKLQRANRKCQLAARIIINYVKPVECFQEHTYKLKFTKIRQNKVQKRQGRFLLTSFQALSDKIIHGKMENTLLT